MKKTNKSILYFGSYDQDYSRNRIIKKGLEANNIEIYECRAQGLVFKRYYNLTMCFLNKRNKIRSIIVGFPGHYDIPLAFALGKIFKKNVYFDIFASTYETYVLDRGVINKNSLRAKFFFLIDWIGLKLADYVLVDTKAHASFYKEIYGVGIKKQIVVYLGSDNDYFFPKKVKETTDVLFYGSYQPLQGVDVIVKAASLLPKIKFTLIGEGQTKKEAQNLANRLKLKNVEFMSWIPSNLLADEISKARITLGIFGNTAKSDVVIPNKVFDSVATKKVVITAESISVSEIFNNKKNIYLVPPENPQELSKAVNLLLTDLKTREQMARNGFNLYDSYLRPRIVVKELLKYLNE